MAYWYNGNIVSHANVSVFSHAMNYSTGIFDSVRLYRTQNGPAFFRLDDHVNRLLKAVQFVGFHLAYSRSQINNAIKALAKKNRLTSGYIRMNVFLAQEQLRVFSDFNKASLAILAEPLNYASRNVDKGVSCNISKYQKPKNTSLPASIKFSANYLTGYLALKKARAQGYDEAILLDSRGFIAEATAQNLFSVKNGVLCTPSEKSEILPGITRKTVFTLAKNEGIKVEETDISIQQLLSSDEIFLTGTAMQIMPVTSVNQKPLVVGPVTQRLIKEYEKLVVDLHPLSKKWLTFL